jgi:hypothetical protein
MKKITIEEDGCETRVITIMSHHEDKADRMNRHKADLEFVEYLGKPGYGKIWKDREHANPVENLKTATFRNKVTYTDSRASAKYQKYKNIRIVQNYV